MPSAKSASIGPIRSTTCTRPSSMRSSAWKSSPARDQERTVVSNAWSRARIIASARRAPPVFAGKGTPGSRASTRERCVRLVSSTPSLPEERYACSTVNTPQGRSPGRHRYAQTANAQPRRGNSAGESLGGRERGRRQAHAAALVRDGGQTPERLFRVALERVRQRAQAVRQRARGTGNESVQCRRATHSSVAGEARRVPEPAGGELARQHRLAAGLH